MRFIIILCTLKVLLQNSEKRLNGLTRYISKYHRSISDNKKWYFKAGHIMLQTSYCNILSIIITYCHFICLTSNLATGDCEHYVVPRISLSYIQRLYYTILWFSDNTPEGKLCDMRFAHWVFKFTLNIKLRFLCVWLYHAQWSQILMFTKKSIALTLYFYHGLWSKASN